jgi:hypothetical protein
MRHAFACTNIRINKKTKGNFNVDCFKAQCQSIVSGLLSFFVFALGHVLINGQTNKWGIVLILTIVGSFACGLPGIIINILGAIDSYQTAERLKAGETIGENEYSNELLYKICKIVDKKATCKAAG